MKQIYDVSQVSLKAKQIYDFEQKEPPMLTERMLQRKLEQQRVKRQAILVTVAGLLTQLLLMVAMILLYEYEPVLAMIGMVYVALSVIGGMATAVIYTWKRRTV